jgi:hypothetical protein
MAIVADDGVEVGVRPGPTGMLEYVTGAKPWYVTFYGSGSSPRVTTPTRVLGVRQGSRRIHTKYGWIATSRVLWHHKPLA